MTEYGPIIGNEVDVEGDGELSDTVYTYYGIPYAKPPVGPLRWKVLSEVSILKIYN